jgi:ribonuclease D
VNAPRWVRTVDELAALVRSLAGQPAVAIDTEGDGFYHYFEKVCLVQVADGAGEVTLVDPLAVKDLSALAPLLADPAVEKVIHSAENDIATLKRDFKFEFAGVFDTHVAARLCGRTEMGLDKLYERELGVKHLKTLQRCDWSRRPLSPAQEHYASEDVRHLIRLRDRLREELRSRGREAWAAEECEELRSTPASQPRESPDFLKTKGAGDLSPRELAVLRELFRLRDEWARRADLPPFMVAGDDALLGVATRRPADAATLSKVPRLPARLKDRRSGDVLAAVRRGEAVPEAELPRRERGPRIRMAPEASARVDRLKAWRAEAAARTALDPGVLLPQRLIERVAIDAPADRAALEAVPGIRRWRVGAFGDEILAAALGRRG